VPIIWGLADHGINFEQMGSVEPVEFCRGVLSRCRVEIIGRIQKHDGRCRVPDCREGAVAQFLRCLPGIRACGKGYFSANGAVVIARKQREHPAKRMAGDGDAFGIYLSCACGMITSYSVDFLTFQALLGASWNAGALCLYFFFRY
jgi:hypothetical protein